AEKSDPIAIEPSGKRKSRGKFQFEDSLDDSEFEFLDDNSVIVKDEDGNLINSDDVEVIRKSTIVTENENENVINMPETIVITKEEDESDNLIKMERERENLDDVNQFKTKLPNDT